MGYNYVSKSMKPFQSINIFFPFSAILMLSGCNNIDNSDVYDPNLVFPNALEISVSPYEYTDVYNGETFQISGDTVLDTLGPMPELRWESFPCDIVTSVISTAPIYCKNGTVVNPEKIIWQWHSGMPEHLLLVADIQYISILFNEGKPVEEKNILYSTQPLSLNSGLYYWAVWGWDESGREVVFSTKPYKFIVL